MKRVPMVTVRRRTSAGARRSDERQRDVAWTVRSVSRRPRWRSLCGAVIVISDTYDPERLDEHVTSMLRRLGTSRKEYVHRMRRFARAAEVLLKPRGAVYAMADPISGITPAELYGALWLLLIADTFRDDGDRARFASEVLEITEDEWKDILRITSLVSERYFGIAVNPD